ncbi:hypothetical protein QF026_008375 [Streptomyces aurantiacus]|nr:hypothetical protein [Streptomyces aurantiacus]
MAVVHRGAGFRRRDRHLSGTIDRGARISLHQLAHMSEGGRAGGAREPRHSQILRRVRARRIPLEYADTERTGRQFPLQQVQPLCEFGR